jgi:hypothetical protein
VAVAHKRRIPEIMLLVLEHLVRVTRVVLLLTLWAAVAVAQALLDNPVLALVLVVMV